MHLVNDLDYTCLSSREERAKGVLWQVRGIIIIFLDKALGSSTPTSTTKLNLKDPVFEK